MVLFAGILNSQLWHLVPLILAVSLVYGATRHELLGPILHHAWKTTVWMLTFMGVIFAALFVLSFWL
ncbi:MAG: hypothetical protein IAF94_20140 [Pirellulaceae bacterium]|nr:hypothetical protein [Pirellulaceae bacterium]